MKIKVKLNNMDYRYDVYHMISMFYKFLDISFVEDDWDICIKIQQNSIDILQEHEIETFKFSNGETIKSGIKKAIFKYLHKKTGKELPWGTLIGIRPSKIALELINQGKDDEYIINYFSEHSLVKKNKAELCIDIAKSEKSLVNKDKNTISVYVGMPFCPTRCLYCSFTSNPIKGCKNVVEPYLKSLCYEIEKTAEYIRTKGLKIQCVYFGGGTPTSINDEQFEKIMEHIYNSFIRKNSIEEFTVECGRPDSITSSKLNTMKKYNVHRISINPQTMNDDTLKLIGRKHTVKDVIDKFKMAREFGFNHINMDIIVGLPGEVLKHVKKTCEEISKLSPDSVTVHGMSVKRASKLHENIVNNIEFSIPEQEELNLMYEETVKLAEKLNIKPYYMYRQKNMVGNMENIGYAKSSKEGLYNIQIIEEVQTIIACGADAATKVVFLDENRIERHANVKDVREYINRTEEMVEKKIKLLNTRYK
ncbi:coproporphyrinogen III oxidase [Clostridium scatologenes]|uniref:Coproporphyrinogen dehydrogenase n=1 Tax=Clostridium scatologenes TaxID=1548 RepID=A0A0E3K3X6_CLOSL|nr:coproporphyrinogen III oxidase [Clostridium scatologenes]AKA71995.1 Coproporphyrinogen dehydrogenase [Clostridium scatologenes]